MTMQAEAFEKQAVRLSDEIARTLEHFEWSTGERPHERYIMERIGLHLGVHFFGTGDLAQAFFREGLKGALRAEQIYIR